MRILALAGRRLAASIPTLVLILIGVFLLLQFAPGDTVDAMMAQMGGGDAATEVDPAKRKALYAQFVKEVNTELPVWMPIEQIFVTVIIAKARNHSNTPRWGSTSWHDLWLSA